MNTHKDTGDILKAVEAGAEELISLLYKVAKGRGPVNLAAQGAIDGLLALLDTMVEECAIPSPE